MGRQTKRAINYLADRNQSFYDKHFGADRYAFGAHDDDCCYCDGDNDDDDDNCNCWSDNYDDCYNGWVCNSQQRSRDCSLADGGGTLVRRPTVAAGAHGGAGSRGG